MRSAAPPKKADDKQEGKSAPVKPPQTAAAPPQEKSRPNSYFYGNDDDDDGIEEIPMIGEQPATNTDMSPQKPTFQQMELPTPSSTSKLEKVQPIE